MTQLDPEFALPSRPRIYLESLEYLNVQIAETEDAIEEHTQDAIRRRREIPILEREAAEHERDAAIGNLKLIDLQAERSRRKCGCK